MSLIQQIYQAAARAGLLKTVRWYSSRQHSKSLCVEWRESDDTMLHNHVLGTDITMTGPSAELEGLKQGDWIMVGQVRYSVRDVRLIHDGSETRATLSTA